MMEPRIDGAKTNARQSNRVPAFDSVDLLQSRKQAALKNPLPLGEVVLTPGALEVVGPGDLQIALSRHSAGDWGEVGRDQWLRNDLAAISGLRISSVYTSARREQFEITTEADRSITTVSGS